MIDPKKATADILKFVDGRLAEGKSLPVEDIGLIFLMEADAAQTPEYEDVSAAEIEPYVRAVLARYAAPQSPEEASAHADELRAFVKHRRQPN